MRLSSRREFFRAGVALASGLAIVPDTVEPKMLAAAGGRTAAAEISRFAETHERETPKWLEWWRNNLLRVDFDMLMTDATPEALERIDPEDIVATAADAGLQGMWGYVLDPAGWFYYPTKIGRQFPHLKGRDLLGQFIAACRKHGLRFVGYYDPFEFGLATQEHPEWRNEYPGDRVPSSPRLWGKLCFNRPGCIEYYLSIVKESLSRYEMDEVYFDDFAPSHCGCADCQKRYKAETGRELPFYQTPQGVAYPDHLRFGLNYPEGSEFGFYFYQLQKWLDQWAMHMRQAAKEIRPDCMVSFNYSRGYYGGGDNGFTVDTAKAADVSGRDCAILGFQFQHSIEFKALRALTQHLPFDAQMPIGEHHGDEVSPKQEGLLKQQLAYIFAHGGGVTYIDDMDWQGRISKKKYHRMKKVNAWSRERFPYLGGQMVADVGLYMSQESNVYHPGWHHSRWNSSRGDAQAGTDFSVHTAGNVAFVQAMIRENVPFDVVHRNKLNNLGRHKVMYLNNVEVMREEEGEALREFVRNGGGLVVTHRTGLRDAQHRQRSNFLLADLIGGDFLEMPSYATSFVAVAKGDRAEGFFTEVDDEMSYFEVHGPPCYVKTRDGVRTLGKVAHARRPYLEDGAYRAGMPPTMQLINPKEISQANAGFRYEAEIITEYPAVILNRFGKGRVVYCAPSPAYDYVDDIHDLIVAAVHWAAGGKLDATTVSNAPPPVEIITLEQMSRKITVTHAINWQASWPGVRAHEVEVGIKSFGRRPKRAYAVEAKSDLKINGDRGYVRVTFPPIGAWETVVIDWM